MRRFDAAFVACGLVMASGCAKDACEAEPASFEATVELAAGTAPVVELDVELDWDGRRFTRRYDVQAALSDGRTAFAVQLDPAPAESVMLTLRAAGLTSDGTIAARGEATFAVEPNGCNRVTVTLGAVDAPTDGGVLDSGSPDGAPTDAGVRDVGPTPDGGVPDGGAPDADAPDTGAVDAGFMDGGPDAAVPDAGPPDAGPDAGPLDAGPGPDAGEPICPAAADVDTVALYAFENDVTDVTGRHDGTVEGGGSVSYAPGPAGCGLGVFFSNSSSVQASLTIPDDAAWHTSEAAIDLSVFVGSLTNRARAVVSRAGLLDSPGDLEVFVACDGTIVVRFVDAVQGEVYRCSEQPLTPGTWSHVEVDLGAPDLSLRVDGRPSGATPLNVGLIGVNCGMSVNCGGPATSAALRPGRDWRIGASSASAVPDQPLRNGGIDALWFRDRRIRP